MRVKDLSRWLDSFGLATTPWAMEPADWATALNLLARLLHPALAQRVEAASSKDEEATRSSESEEAPESEEAIDDEQQQKGREDQQQLLTRRPSSQAHPSTQLALQEALEMAERVLGVPQFAVVADLKRGPAENQLALFVSLCALHFAMGQADTKPFRDFQFAFRIYFDMDSDGSRRECAGCGQLVHLIERLVLNGQPWHRACLKCSLCGRQLYRGAFHFVAAGGGDVRLECAEHQTNAVLFGDPKQRLAALPPSALMSASQHSALAQPAEKRASLVSSTASQCSPPPRPPPPRIGGPKLETEKQKAGEEAAAEEEEGEEESIEKKIARAAAARHDAPVPRPRQSLLKQGGQQPQQRGRGAEKTSWEVLEYPVELNPFGSDEEEEDEEEEEEEEGSDLSRVDKKARQKQGGGGANPFETDSGEEEEDGEGGMVQVDNPQDRVLASPSSGGGSSSTQHTSSCCPSPRAAAQPAMVQLVQPDDGQLHQSAAAGHVSHNQQQPLSVSVDCDTLTNSLQYIPPLGPMPFRMGQEKQSTTTTTTAAKPSISADQQQQLHELDTKLRRLHAQLDQWEITGARLEGQMLRELQTPQKENQQTQQPQQQQVWRKGNKLANEFAQLVEQRCAALAMEGLLVRRYMDIFLALTHAELDRQMRDEQQQHSQNAEVKRRQFNDLLAQLLHIRNELTELERREREAKAARAATTTASSSAENATKEKKTKKKEKLKKEPSNKEKEQPSNKVEEAKEGQQKKLKVVDTDGAKKEGKEKGVGGGGRLLKNTLKSLKKKL